MARPNFKQGKPIALLLIATLLDRLLIESPPPRANSPKLSFVNFKQTQGRLIRLKGTIAQFLTLIQDTAPHRQPWLEPYSPEQPAIAQFYQQPASEQKQALKVAFHCLHHCGILSDQREAGANTEYRHSLLKLAHPLIDPTALSQNLQWLFQPQGQWDQGKQRGTPNPQKSNSPAPTARSPQTTPTPPVPNFSPTKLLKWAKLLPQDLSHYTPDRLQDLGDLIPDLADLLTLAIDLSPTDQHLVLESLLRFSLASGEITQAETYLQHIGQLLTGRSPLTDAALASYHHYLGVYHYQQGELSSAQTWFTQAQSRWQQLWQQTHNPDNPSVPVTSAQENRTLEIKLANTCHNLSCTALAQRDLATAETAIVQAIQHRRQLGAIIDLASSLLILGHIRSEQQRWAEAAQIYTQTQTHFRLALERHPLWADFETSLGHLHAKQGNFPQAEHHYHQAIAGITQLEGPNSPRLALPQAGLADMTRFMAAIVLPPPSQPSEQQAMSPICVS